MDKDNFDALPEDMQPVLEHIVKNMYIALGKKNYLTPVWFMIDRANERIAPFSVPFSSEAEKRLASTMMREIIYAQRPEVDAVIFVCEAWKKTETRGTPGFNDRTTPVRDREGRTDIVMLMVETYDGIWTAEPEVHGEPGEDRKLVTPVVFEKLTLMEGQMTGYLPPRDKKEVN